MTDAYMVYFCFHNIRSKSVRFGLFSDYVAAATSVLYPYLGFLLPETTLFTRMLLEPEFLICFICLLSPVLPLFLMYSGFGEYQEFCSFSLKLI